MSSCELSVHSCLAPPTGAESKESIQNQQADLQAKILSLLGSSAVVPSGNSSQGSTRGPNSHSSQMAGSQYWSYGSKW